MRLDELLAVRHRNVRSVNLDEDFGRTEVLDGYSLGAHVLDALRRIAAGFQAQPRTRAWSVTGPYGTGKSSFALFLAALLGPERSPASRAAMKLLRAGDPQLGATLARERKRLDIGRRGAIPALAVAAREPTLAALLRALHRGAAEFWSGPGRTPPIVGQLAKAVESGRPNAELLLEAVERLSKTAPIVIVIDELGKTLEYAADGSGEGDLFILQQLAERLSGSERFEGTILTLQHLAFEDYLVGAGEARRREWRKVHGRFEDLPFVSDASHTWRLVGDAIEPRKRDLKDWKRVGEAARTAAAGVHEAAPHLPDPAQTVGEPEALYPLHPLTALALPELTARLGQHDRSLVAFLASDAPHGLRAFLAEAELRDGAVPFLRPDVLYDYFFEDGAATTFAGPDSSLAREIQARVEGAQVEGLGLRLLKATAVLNMASGALGVKASEGALFEAVLGPSGASDRAAFESAMSTLAERSLLTFRRFAGEYRVWEGSDFDIAGEVGTARERLSAAGDVEALVLETVREFHPLRPPVAQRYSQRRHVLRYFDAKIMARADQASATVTLAGADGLVAWVLASDKAPTRPPARTTDGRPLVIVWSPYLAEIREIALDLRAATAVLAEAPELDSDAVARRELRHRIGLLQSALIDAVDRAFDSGREGVRWFAEGRGRRAGSRANFSALLSEICERRFDRTPAIRNEMLNRRELTSQGAKARRDLLERMFAAPAEPQLGIDGFGPERAMYEAVLRHTGLHAERDTDDFAFGPPSPKSELADVWAQIMDFFDDAAGAPRGIDELYARLAGPPFGLKEGPIPVLLAAALIYRAEDVFLYQEGTFQPTVEAIHIERLLKAPDGFAVKRAALIGLRAEVFEQLRGLVGASAEARPATRNASTLMVVRPLIKFVRDLPDYALQTAEVSGRARAVAAALLEAREPDELLFRQLPEACGMSAIPLFAADGSKAATTQATEFISALRSALAELGGAYDRLLDRIAELVRYGFADGVAVDRLREDLRSRALRLAPRVIDPKLRAFLLTAGDTGFDSDREWLEALAMTLAAKPPSSWSDHDLTLFEALVAERAGWFHRLELLVFEMQSKGETGFEARRLTLTAPDGREEHTLVAVDAASQELVADVLDEAIARLEERLGPQAQSKLLGAVAARVLTEPVATPESVESTAKPKRRKSA